jgi:hypothetical protein
MSTHIVVIPIVDGNTLCVRHVQWFTKSGVDRGFDCAFIIFHAHALDSSRGDVGDNV